MCRSVRLALALRDGSLQTAQHNRTDAEAKITEQARLHADHVLSKGLPAAALNPHDCIAATRVFGRLVGRSTQSPTALSGKLLEVGMQD
jgi:hypothetical protein